MGPAAVWRLQVRKSGGGFQCPLLLGRGGRDGRVIEFGRYRCSQCLVLTALLLIVLSPGADGGLSIFMLLAGRNVLRYDIPENPTCVSTLAAVGLMCLESCKAPSAKIQQDTVCDKLR